jgi:hypothetical protein
VNGSKHLNSNAAYGAHDLYRSLFSLQREIGGLGGFCETHRVRSEVDHTFASYLPTFAIALPLDECSKPICAPLSSKRRSEKTR